MIRILIVEDQAGTREVIRVMLEQAGFEVIEAKEGAEALRLYRSQPADIILCDIFMPGKEGLETIQIFCREFPGIKIIAMSGDGYANEIDVLTDARNLGAKEILYKPFDQSALLEKINNLMA